MKRQKKREESARERESADECVKLVWASECEREKEQKTAECE